MSRIHFIARQIVVTERAQHAYAADAQEYFLAEAVIGVSTVQASREVTVALRVGGQIRIQKVDGPLKSTHSGHGVAPGTQLDPPALQRDGYPRIFFGEKILDPPFHRVLGLCAILGE